MAVQSFWLARHFRFKRELASMPEGVDVHLLPTGEAPDVRYNDFTRTAELIALAYEASSDYLAGRPARPALPAGGSSRRRWPGTTTGPRAARVRPAQASGSGSWSQAGRSSGSTLTTHFTHQ